MQYRARRADAEPGAGGWCGFGTPAPVYLVLGIDPLHDSVLVRYHGSMKSITTAQLARAQARSAAATQRADALRDERDDLICRAVTEGWTHGRIAEATGLTRGRIVQLVPKRRRVTPTTNE